MKKLKKLLSAVLTVAMVMSLMSMTVFAAPERSTATIDTDKTGSITVHKYEYNGNNKGTGTGEVQTLPDGSTPLSGVTFTLYKVMDQDEMLAYYNGTSTNEVSVSTYVENGAIKENVAIGNATSVTTDVNGVATFANLDLGMYVIVETNYPEKVTNPAAPFLVSVPMTATNTTEWLYDINVYPKNSTSEGNVNLTKKNKAGDKIAGVKFKLEKEGDNSTWAQVGDISTTNGAGEVSWQNLAHGDYRITEVSAPAGYIVDTRPIEFTVTESSTITCADNRTGITVSGTDSKTLSITLVNEQPDMDKYIVEGNTDTHEANAAIGATVNYKITVDVPDNITNMLTFNVTDVPTYLKDNIATIKIKYGTTELTKDATGQYTVAENGNGYIITFNCKKMNGYGGKKLDIEYTATVLADAASGGKAQNTAILEYSNKIFSDTSGDGTPDIPSGELDTRHTIKDSAVVYNYKIDITKYKDSVTIGNELSGVQFELYDNAGNKLYVVETTSGTKGAYRLAITDDTSKVSSLETGTNGKITVTGLAAGTYYLKETQTATGYNLLKDRVTVSLSLDTTTSWDMTDTFEDGELVKHTWSSVTYSNTTDANHDIANNYVSTNIINKAGFELPQTGGMGTFLFSIVGAILMIGGGFILLRSYKKKSA